MRLGIIAKIIGVLLLLLGTLTCIPLFIAIEEGEAINAWLWTMGTAFFFGGLGVFAGRKADPEKDLGIREGIAITTLFWVCASLNAAVAIYLDVANTTFMQAWFECMSGLTTTGSTVFGSFINEDHIEVGTYIESLPPSILFWRAALQWMGGIGIVVISIALIPLLIGGSGFQLYRAEIPGLHADRLSPRLSTTARILVSFYCVVTMLLTLALMLCGVDLFDAVCHAMCTIATGGFSTFDNSVEGLNSSAAEWIIIIGMIMGGINFSLLIQAIRGKPLNLLRNSEARVFLSFVVIAWAAICCLLRFQTDLYAGETHDLVRDSLFQVASLGTSTGFVSGYDTDPLAYEAWPPAAILILIFFTFTCGCAGSTSGGMKIARVLVLFKIMRHEMRRYVEPARVTPITLDGHSLNNRTIFQVHAFMFLYFVTLAIGALCFALLGHDATTSFSAALSAISNIGPGIGEIGPSKHFGNFDDASLFVSICLMLIGRLELLTVLVTLRPKNWLR